MPDIVAFSADEAEYIGDERDGIYYQTAEGPGGWYLTIVVDSDTGGFVDTITKDDGPHSSEAEALQAGKDVAIGWCIDNGVTWADQGRQRDKR